MKISSVPRGTQIVVLDPRSARCQHEGCRLPAVGFLAVKTEDAMMFTSACADHLEEVYRLPVSVCNVDELQ